MDDREFTLCESVMFAIQFDEELTDEMKSHIDSCEECRTFRKQYEIMSGDLKELSVPLLEKDGVTVADSVMDEVEKRQIFAAGPKSGKFISRHFGLIAACIIVAVMAMPVLSRLMSAKNDSAAITSDESVAGAPMTAKDEQFFAAEGIPVEDYAEEETDKEAAESVYGGEAHFGTSLAAKSAPSNGGSAESSYNALESGLSDRDTAAGTENIEQEYPANEGISPNVSIYNYSANVSHDDDAVISEESDSDGNANYASMYTDKGGGSAESADEKAAEGTLSASSDFDEQSERDVIVQTAYKAAASSGISENIDYESAKVSYEDEYTAKVEFAAGKDKFVGITLVREDGVWTAKSQAIEVYGK